ncbi:MAG: hypothetical protein WC755_04680 [Candidatus Woesearchaeota archaeon]|jgi:ribonuclease HIII
MKSIPNADIKDVVKLKEFGFLSIPVCSPFEVLRLTCEDPKAVVILFSSNKFLIQTSKANEIAVLELFRKVGIKADYSELKKESEEKLLLLKEKQKVEKEKKLVEKVEKEKKLVEKVEKEKKLVEKVEKKDNVKTKKIVEKNNSVSEKEKLKKENAISTQELEDKKPIIGSDESLKGDTFGGIVVAAVYADEKIRKKLEKLNVRDSKLIQNQEIERLAPLIMEIAPYSVENIFPKYYNNYEVTPLLNRLHADVALMVKKETGRDDALHIVDKYPGCKVGDIITEKAESKYIEVAAASILARHFALKQIEELSKIAGFQLPLGSTHVYNSLMQLKNSGLVPEEFVKTKFVNVRDVFFNK